VVAVLGALEHVDASPIGQLADLASELLPCVGIEAHGVGVDRHAAGVEVLGGFD